VIVDNLLNARRYQLLNPGIGPAIEFLHRPDLSSLIPGRYDLVGDEVYVLVSHYASGPMSEHPWEAHRRYIDLHYIVGGTERIGYAPVGRMHAESYDEAKDMLRLSGTGDFRANPPVLNAVGQRLTHYAEIIPIEGESYRKREADPTQKKRRGSP
jgi:YhcH/YjgK/YiaL family protein